MKKQPQTCNKQETSVQQMVDELQPKPVYVSEDLDNQILSKDLLQRARQLDQQAQEAEERIAEK
ncbi:MAG TPA: hypothetical protein VKV15_04645 [Bryobacteraceae bacterium]|nr:hypothetical protein [Bryobacteraceae bacterium]